MNNQKTTVKGFKVIAIIALIWNVLGVFSYFFHTFMPAEAIAKLSEAEQALYANIPLWKSAAFFVATIGGLLGSVLLLKKKTAVCVLLASLIGIIISFYYDFFKTKLIEIYGNESVIMPSMILITGVFLVWYSNKFRLNGFLE